jgi:capsular exopolysaccharide synthesis family protein
VQEGSAAAALEAATREAVELSRRSLKYDALKRELEASKRLSENAITRQKQTDASQNVPASNVHIIDAAAVPRGPERPRPVRDVALAVFFGLGAAVAVAFLRDYLDRSVSVPSDAKRLGLPVLGVIEEKSGRRGTPLLVTGSARRETFGEAYRVLRTAIETPADLGHGQLLLVTSTLPGEGKSLTSVNLALTLASADERVLLVDADLRRPTLGELLHARPAPGLSDIVLRGASLESAVQRVSGTRLNLLTAGGPVDGNPADVLGRTSFRDLLASVRGHFDRVIVDTAPAGIVADALMLAPQADGVIVVAHSGRVMIHELAQTVERLLQARARVLGLVLNRARPRLVRYDYGASVPLGRMGSGRGLPAGADGTEIDPSGRPH